MSLDQIQPDNISSSQREPRARLASVLLTVLLLGSLSGANEAQAQRPGPPAADEISLPNFAPSEEESRSVLPTLSLPPGAGRLAIGGGRIFVRGFELRGARVLSASELAPLLAPYVGRLVSFADLQAVRDRVTQAYLDRGYLSSGAILPGQEIEDGIVVLDVIEGQLTGLDVETDGRLRSRYLTSRLELDAEPAANVYAIERRLQRLESDPRIQRVQAELVPGERRGESTLRVRVAEAPGLRMRASFDNAVSPSIGAERARIELDHVNLSGWGDALSLFYARTRGLAEWGGRYEIPVHASDASVDLHVRGSRSDIVESPFDALDIESRSLTCGVTLRVPVHRTLADRLDLSLAADYRRSKSFLLGRAFDFSPGLEDGEATVAVLRFGQDYSSASQRQVFAARSILSVGVGALGASTGGSGSIPDGRFVAWLGQVQWARRLETLGAQVIVRGDVQLSNDPLFGLEQLAVGGQSSVRGYRENELVGDNGAIGSVELRVPIWQRADGRAAIELAPFVDAGKSWNRGRPSPGPRTLASAGIGVRVSLSRRLLAEIYWAKSLRDIRDDDPDRDLQDAGLHFRITSAY